MRSKLQSAFFALTFVIASVGVGSNALADSQADALRRGASRRVNPSPSFQLEGFRTVDSIEKLDLNRGLSASDLQTIQSALHHLLMKRTATRLPSANALWNQWLSNRSSEDLRNVFFYLGGSTGNLIGVGANLGLTFAHTHDGVLAVYPVIFARVQAVQFGSEFHFGLGELNATIPNVSSGFTLGGALLVGGALGKGDAWFRGNTENSSGDEFWLEAQFGVNFQAGGYIEFML